MPASQKPKTAPKRYVEYTEASGRTVQSLQFWHSPEDGQAISIQFTDGTHIYIGIEALLKVKAEVGALRDGDLKVNRIYPAIVGSPIA